MWIKAEMDKLTVEQQDVVARLELSVVRQREQLLKEARGHGSWLTALEGLPYIVGGIGFFTLPFLVSQKGAISIICACSGSMFVFVYALINHHTARVHRRLDALLKLLDFDRNSKDDSNNSKTEKAG
jgi:hypothetical protein